MPRLIRRLLCLSMLVAWTAWAQVPQPLDEEYTRQIRQYTTEPFFLTELVDHMPASASVPSPFKFLGYVPGTPQKLTYAKDIHRYFRELEKSSPRVKVYSMGQTEEGREMIVAFISSEENLRRLDELRQTAAKLADPRSLSTLEAEQRIASGIPFYWATGGMHSPETGSPEMLMELAYRLAVSESPFIRQIRDGLVVMITPVLEVDGRERQVDVYNYKVANPDKTPMRLVYWGKYVAHDNNRDGMALSLALSRNIVKTYLEYHPQVVHDLHESIPFLYISTGMGPYNAWLDPIVINEWQRLAYYEVEEMTKRGVPGVWTHGFYDGWAANYMFTVAHGHNAIGRFYETYGAFGADVGEREVPESYTRRAWFRPNPPLPRVRWSLRNNINLQQSALLLALNFTARNRQEFLRNFYLKSKRSVEKPRNEGPAAYVIPASEPRRVEAARLVSLLRLHGIEVHRLKSKFTVGDQVYDEGSYVIRMDQPYSRMADMLLDRAFYNPNDTSPYDDTGWTLGPLRHVRTDRITDLEILKAPAELLKADPRPAGSVHSSGRVFLVNHNADSVLATFRFRLHGVRMEAAEKAFRAADREFAAGSFLVRQEGNPPDLRARLEKEARELGVEVFAVPQPPDVPTHPVAEPRIALVHTWLSTQNEGWYRLAFDQLGIPYDYISDQRLASIPRLREKYDVILFGPTPGSPQRIVNGLPKYGDPVPWKAGPLTPNIGSSPDQTEDLRGGMGLEGLLAIDRFVQEGGLFITIAGNASLPIDYGLVDFLSIQEPRNLKARGSVLRVEVADPGSPIVYGYDKSFAVYFNQTPIFRLSVPGDEPSEPQRGERPSGRGSLSDPDIPQGRPILAPENPPEGKREPTAEARERLRGITPPAGQRPRVVMKFAPAKELLVSGMLAGGEELAGKPAIIDIPKGKGHYLFFANNPVWRNQTQGSFSLLFNAMLHFEHLDAGHEKGSEAEGGGSKKAE